MNYNYSATGQILSALNDLIDITQITVSTENTDYQGHLYQSDYVVLEPESKIAFEVEENEIRIDFFDDHTHFGQVGSEEDATYDYVQEAIAFLRKLFTTPLVKLETFQRKKRVSFEWFLLLPDQSMHSLAGKWFDVLFVNPFLRKKLVRSVYSYQRSAGKFLVSANTDDVIDLISYTWDLTIEIRKASTGYSYCISQLQFDEDDGTSGWIQVNTGASFFDSQQKAFAAAKQEAKAYRNQSK